MADDRERFAQILCRIWDDDDWKTLSPRAQWFYMLLVSQASLNRAGIIALTTRRWAKLATGANVAEQVSLAMAELEKARFIVVDQDSEELFVRSYMRNDGLAKRPNVLKRALREALEVLSSKIRKVLVAELQRLGHPDADLAADTIEKGLANPFEKGYAMRSPNPSAKGPNTNGSRKGSRNPGGRGKGSSTSSVGSNSPSRAAEPKAASQQRQATSTPTHLLVTADMRQWARDNGVTADLDAETEQMLDRHRSKGSTFKDWTAAWRTWMRNTKKFNANGHAQPVIDEFQLPTPPPEIRDDPDPDVFHRWARDQHAEWEASRA